MHLKRFLMTAAFLASLPAAVLADKTDDTLDIVFTKDLDNPDIYFSTAREATLVGFSVFDALVYRDPITNEYVGNLATEWSWLDDLTLEMKLREGVTFHNGEAFTASDVAYTVNTMKEAVAPGALTSMRWIDSVEVVDDFTVRSHAGAPFPAAMDYIAQGITIYPEDYYSEVGSAGFARQPIGTGPYQFQSITPGQGFTLVANEAYFDGPKSRAQIGTVNVRTIPDVNTQLAEMMTGNADLLWQVPDDQAAQMARRDDLEVVQASTMRIGYITMDAVGRNMAEGPFRDPRVRQAVYHAIDRTAIRDALMSPAAQIINSACHPIQFGCYTDVTTHAYDPDQARALLAEAGYPNGFTTKFYAYRDRPLAEAMIGMLAEVGITVEPVFLQYAAAVDAITQNQVPMAFMTWGSGSIGDITASTSRFFNGGDWDDARDPRVIELLNTGDNSISDEARIAAYTEALSIIADEVYWVPLWTYSTNYLLANGLNFTPTEDEIIRFYDIAWD